MDIYDEKQHLIEKISRYEAEIESLKKDNTTNCKKIKQLENNIESVDKLINDSSVPILTGNKKGQIIGANNKALKLSKYSFEDLIQKKISDILVNQNVSEEIPKKVLKKNTNEITNEQILIKKSGKKIFVQTQTKLLPNSTYQIIIKKTHKRKKAELALIELQNRYKQLAENIKDVIWTATADLKIVYISGLISKITGFNPEIYYQRPLNELITPISYQMLLDTMEKEKELLKADPKSKNRYPISLEIKLLQKEHSNVWVELSIALVQNQFGETVGFQGIIRNIDDHKKTLENLNRSNHRYNFAIKSSGTGIWELNADLTSISIDNNLISMLGYENKKPKALLNDWINLTYKDDRISIIDILQDILDGKKESYAYECRRIHKNGSVYWFNDYVEGIYDENGSIVELIGTSKNITNEKLTEEKKFRYYAGLQILIESTFQFLRFEKLDQIYNYTGHVLAQKIPDSIVIFSSIHPNNNQMVPVRFYGIDEPELLEQTDIQSLSNPKNTCTISKKALNLLNQKFLIEFKHGIEEFMEHDSPGKICETICNTYKNYRFYIIGLATNGKLAESVSIIIKDGSEISNKEFIEAFISLSSIIIDKKKIEIELKKSNETKDKFFSIISHDLKNPFNTFIGFSNLIVQNIDKIEKEKILEFAQLINEAAKNSHEMMNNLFEWVSAQRGSLKCKPVKIHIKELISSNINLFSSEAQKKEVRLNLKSGPDIDLYADNDMLSTILRNLLSNAIKFTNSGDVVEISFKQKDNSVIFSIKDNGTGISSENVEKLFHINSNKSTEGTNKEKGTGLGLILCKEFVKIHGGEIWVESELGKGSEFLFSIPLSQ